MLDFNVKTESTIDPNAIALLVLGIVIAGASILLIAKLVK